MRRINLILATTIGIVGMIIYFMSIPTVNEDGLVNLQVETGDKQVLEDIYFTGYIENYSEFYLDQDEMKTIGSLSYLERLDAPYNMELFNLQEEYPDLIDPIYYDRGVYMYSFLNGEDYLISSHMKENEHNYYIDSEYVYLNVLNKDTGKTEEEVITREDTPQGDQINIIGMYENFPTVKMIYTTSSWDQITGTEESVVSLGEYNFETKSYSEERLLNEEGAFHPYGGDTDLLENQERQLFTFYGSTPDDSSSNFPMYIFDYTKNELIPFDTEGKEYTIGDNGQLYALDFTDDEALFTQYDEAAQEATHKVALDPVISQKLSDERMSLLTKVMDDQLFIIQNTINFDTETSEVQPSELQVFDIKTGEHILKAKIHFNENNEANTWSANIVKIGQRTE